LAAVITSLKRRGALWLAILALALAGTLAYAQFQPEPPRILQNIEQTSHKNTCSKYKKGSKKKRKCKEDCGVGPGGYGRPNDHPNHPNQCRDW
jgi:hypothetical protein